MESSQYMFWVRHIWSVHLPSSTYLGHGGSNFNTEAQTSLLPGHFHQHLDGNVKAFPGQIRNVSSSSMFAPGCPPS